jgi:hypothetical protein
MAVPIRIFINGEELTPPAANSDLAAQWDVEFEERIDGVGTARVVIQDRLNEREFGASNLMPGQDPLTVRSGGAPERPVGWRDILEMKTTDGGIWLFKGEITSSSVSLPAGFPFRRWTITASDWNSLMDSRLVGYPDGQTWETIDGGETWNPIDPAAEGQETDAETVQHLFDVYVRKPPTSISSGPPYPEGDAFNTTTFVHSWVAPDVMIDPDTGRSHFRWTNTTLRSALDELRGLVGHYPINCWIDPDDNVHWESLRDFDILRGFGLPLMEPDPPYTTDAVARVTDVTDEINGTTVVGGRNLEFEWDSSFMPQNVYVIGTTDFVYNAAGSYTEQGTGWDGGGWLYDLPHGPQFRQYSVDAESHSRGTRRSVGRSYSSYARRARLRARVTVGSPTEKVDGWRCGSLLQVNDSRLTHGGNRSLTGKQFPIQRVGGRLKPGQDWIEYTLEFGDFPQARFSQKYQTQPQRLVTARLPAKRHIVELPTHHLLPSTTYTCYSQMVDHSNKPFRRQSIKVVWGLTVTDNAGAPVSAGSITPITDPMVTNQHGRTAAHLTTGSTTGLHYHVTAITPTQSA